MVAALTLRQMLQSSARILSEWGPAVSPALLQTLLQTVHQPDTVQTIHPRPVSTLSGASEGFSSTAQPQLGAQFPSFASQRQASSDQGSPQPQPRPQPQPQPPTQKGQDRWGEHGWTRSEIFNAPNAISLARLLSGPPIAAMIVHELWAPALCCLAVSSASDWLDGFLARRWNQGSRLGSYLDPLADKVLIGSTVAALSIEGSLPAWLAYLIVGRDVLLVAGTFAYRLHTLGWRRSSLQEFFRLSPGLSEQHFDQCPPSVPAAEAVQPLLISKVNTGLQLTVVAACIGESWYGWPGSNSVWLLTLCTGMTTAASGGLYAWLMLRRRQ